MVLAEFAVANSRRHTGVCVCDNKLLVRKPLPCNPSAETDPQTPDEVLWEPICPKSPSFFGGVFFHAHQHHTVSSHNFNSQRFKFRVSNPWTIAYVHLKMPFKNSNIPRAGPIFPDWTFENWPYLTLGGHRLQAFGPTRHLLCQRATT